MTDSLDCVQTEKQVTETLLAENAQSQASKNDKSSCNPSVNLARYLLSIALGGGFFGMGFASSIFGLALPTLAENLSKELKDVSPVLIARGAGYLSGSLIMGFLERKVDIHFLTISALTVMTVGLVLTPVILNLVVFYVTIALSRLGMGSYETIANVFCLYLWGKKAEPVMQFLHFCFCLGSAITPFVAKPFLNEAQHANSSVNESYVTLKYIDSSGIPFISIPYFIFSVFLVVIIIFIALLRTCKPLSLSESQQKNTIKLEGKRFRLGMLLFLFTFYFVYVAMEASFSSFLYAFSISSKSGLGYSKEIGSNLIALSLFSIVVGQFCAIFMSKKFSPTTILTVDLLGVAVGAIIMMILPTYSKGAQWIFWIAIAMTGLFRTSIYGTTFLWAERYITVNGRAACTFIIGGALGEMTLPIPVGQLIASEPLSFLYFHGGFTLSLILLFVAMRKFASTQGQRLKRDVLGNLSAQLGQSEDGVSKIESTVT
ncbi:unnamed protein product [Clavelina lepadiformis]|uniref:Uncharacterized protein n=1 Tax=Clavelina lepadiformis TaxID=159417 RepID=A0ABP0GA72_CLALP